MAKDDSQNLISALNSLRKSINSLTVNIGNIGFDKKLDESFTRGSEKLKAVFDSASLGKKLGDSIGDAVILKIKQSLNDRSAQQPKNEKSITVSEISSKTVNQQKTTSEPDTKTNDEDTSEFMSVGLAELGLRLAPLYLIKHSLSELNQINTDLLSVGKSNISALKDGSVQFSESTGGFANVASRLQFSFEATRSGLGNMNENTTKLILSQKLLGEDYAKTIGLMSASVAGTGMNSVAVGDLSKSLLSFSDSFGVKVDDLITVLADLKNTQLLSMASGGSSGSMKGMAQVTAALGPQMGKEIAKIMDSMVGMGGVGTASLLGGGELLGLRSGLTTAQGVVSYSVESMKAANQRFKEITSTIKDTGMAIDIFKGMYGEQAAALAMGFEELTKRASESGQSISEYVGKQVTDSPRDNALGKISEAFMGSLTSWSNIMVAAITAISPVLEVIAKGVGFLLPPILVIGARLSAIFVLTKASQLLQGLANKQAQLSNNQLGLVNKNLLAGHRSIKASIDQAAAKIAASNAASSASGALAGLGSIVRIVGVIGRVLSFVTGPWGLVITALLSFLPTIIGWFTGDDNKNDETSKSLNNIDENTKKEKEDKHASLLNVLGNSMVIRLSNDFDQRKNNNENTEKIIRSNAEALEKVASSVDNGAEAQVNATRENKPQSRASR
jgi:hypothetical protein